MLIHFPKARFWVVPADLLGYASWRARTAESVRDVARSFWTPRFHKRYHEQLEQMLVKAAELGVTPGCLRFPSDGTRLQVFDFARGVVCKMQAPWARENRIAHELEIRGRVGDLAPAVVRVAEGKDAFVEAWAPHSRSLQSRVSLDRIASHLARVLYGNEQAQSRNVVDSLRSARGSWNGLPCEIAAALIANLPDEVPVSQIHGDLSPRNMNVRRGGTLQLLDWEYTRSAVRTYDVWHYLYEARRNAGSLGQFTAEFTLTFAACLGALGCLDLQRYAHGLHVLHLVERLSFLCRVVDEERVTVLANILRADIADGAKLLTNALPGAAA